MEGCLVLMLVVVVVVVAVIASRRVSSGERSSTGIQAGFSRAPEPVPVPARSRRKSSCEGDRFWVPASRSATLGSRAIGGMLYLGKGMRAVSEWQGIEPALIDPGLRVSWGNPDHEGRLMSYWPSYSQIQPASRAAYAEWLARGRSDPAAYVGYVFLYFYGIERRVLVDARESDQAREEVDLLTAEVERLRAIYRRSRSFQGYTGSFLSVARVLHRPFSVSDLVPPEEPQGFEIPLTLKIALGSFAAAGEPIPPEWALSWLFAMPGIPLRTPARRCAGEFRDLFKIRYSEAFPDGGLKVKPGKSRIAARYQPSSPTFRGSLNLTLPGFPDVTLLQGPFRKLQEIADQVCNELDVYSRWVGRTSDGASPAALALLPPEIARSRESEESIAFVGWVEDSLAGGSSAVVRCDDLFARWPVQTPGKVASRDLEMLSTYLAGRGYGMEPDVRFGGPAARQGSVVLFRLPEGAEGVTAEPGAACHAAALLLHLAATVSAVDGDVTEAEERHLLAHLESALHLSAAERARLEAHLRWLLADPPGLAGIRKRIEPLLETQRRAIGHFLISVAGSDGHVGPEELKILTKIYGLLGLEPQAVYSDVHALAAAEAPTEPVPVRPSTPGPGGFAIPKQPAPASGMILDPEKIKRKLVETEQVAGILDGIFAEEEAPAAAPQAPAKPAGEAVAGLDAAHSALLRELGARASWERVEIERLTATLGLLPDGALEILNEAAFERCGAPLLEGDETIEIDPDILKELLA